MMLNAKIYCTDFWLKFNGGCQHNNSCPALESCGCPCNHQCHQWPCLCSLEIKVLIVGETVASCYICPRIRALTFTFQRIVQYLLVAQIGMCHNNFTRLKKIVVQGKTQWQADKEAIGLCRDLIFFHLYITRPSQIFVNFI